MLQAVGYPTDVASAQHGRPRTLAETAPSRSSVDAVLAACRYLVAVSVRSFDAVESQVNLLELRILVVTSSLPSPSLSDVAVATGVHLSRASRSCERLVQRGLLKRRDDPSDRRQLKLSLTSAGGRVLSQVTAARRAAVTPALARMAPGRVALLGELLEELSEAAGEPASSAAWEVVAGA